MPLAPHALRLTLPGPQSLVLSPQPLYFVLQDLVLDSVVDNLPILLNNTFTKYREVSQMKQVTLKALYDKVSDLQRDIAKIKQTLVEEPELREDFIRRMRDIESENSIPVVDFGKRYGLK